MTRNKCVIYIFSVAIISFSLVMLHKTLKQGEVCFREHCFSVEIAKTKFSQAKGLMFRRELPTAAGMLFIFNDESPRSFWMKNTFLPLDMIFLNKNKEVVAIEKNVQPCETDECPKIRPPQPAKYVLELNANIADKLNLKPGDKLDFDLDK